MAVLLQVNRVQYKCFCELTAPISQLYFCKYCKTLRCKQCVLHEVDVYYCPNCLETVPFAEAKMKKNRCGSCFDCPSCSHTLMTRATSVQVQPAAAASEAGGDSSKAKVTPTSKKQYYLACNFCRWTSRDAGIPDKPIASGGWQEPENRESNRVHDLLQYYQQVSQQEKLDRDQRKSRRRNLLHYQGLTGARRSRGNSILAAFGGLSARELEMDTTVIQSIAAEPSEDIDALPEFHITCPVYLSEICTLPQRLDQPEFQPNSVRDLKPFHKPLIIKRSQRCKGCEHNLLKPDFMPTSIKFKIEFLALLLVPEMRIYSVPQLSYMKECDVKLSLTNPVDYPVAVSLKSLTNNDHASITATLTVPCEVLNLNPKDDAADFDDVSESKVKQESSAIVSCKGNKIQFLVRVRPDKPLGNVMIGLRLSHNYRDTSSTVMTSLQEDKKPVEPVMINIDHDILLNLGKITH